jgi:hypothetical protein
MHKLSQWWSEGESGARIVYRRSFSGPIAALLASLAIFWLIPSLRTWYVLIPLYVIGMGLVDRRRAIILTDTSLIYRQTFEQLIRVDFDQIISVEKCTTGVADFACLRARLMKGLRLHLKDGEAVAIPLDFQNSEDLLKRFLNDASFHGQPRPAPMLTRAMKDASVRSMRIIHGVLLVMVAIYFVLAELLNRPPANLPIELARSLTIFSALLVLIAFGIRRRLLPSAVYKLRQGEANATELRRWRVAEMLSMILAMSVALIAFALRFMGGTRTVVWPLFIVSLVLMLLWRPHLDQGTDGQGISPSILN